MTSTTTDDFASGGSLADQEQWRPAYNPWIVALTVTLATFMEVLDTSIANVALPHIAGNLSATADEATWVLTSYLVSNAIVLPLSGWLSSIFGRKRFYMSCVVLFTTSSALCGFAPSLSWLVFFRILQGLGGGGLQPSEQAILMDTFPRQQRGMGMAIYGVAVVVAPILGPTLGGWITDSFSWRWVFFINVPIGALSLMLSSIIVQDPPFLRRRRGHKRWSIDYIGLGLIALGIGALQVVLDKGERDDWLASRFILVLAVVAVVALVAAVAWEWFHKDPMVDLHLLKDRNFAVSVVLMFMLGVVLFGSTVLLPLFLQLLMGYSATDAGLVLSPGGVVTMAMMPVVGILLSRFEPRWLIVFGLIVVAVSLHMMARFDLQIDYWTAANARMVQGMGLAFLFPPINTAAYAFLPRDKNNQASGLINLARNLGGSFGIAFVATLVARSSQWHQSYLAGHVSAYSPTYQHTAGQIAQALHAQGVTALNAMQMVPEIVYGQVVRQAQMLSYLDAFGILVILFLAMVPLVFLMRKPRHHDGGMAMH